MFCHLIMAKQPSLTSITKRIAPKILPFFIFSTSQRSHSIHEEEKHRYHCEADCPSHPAASPTVILATRGGTWREQRPALTKMAHTGRRKKEHFFHLFLQGAPSTPDTSEARNNKRPHPVTPSPAAFTPQLVNTVKQKKLSAAPPPRGRQASLCWLKSQAGRMRTCSPPG